MDSSRKTFSISYTQIGVIERARLHEEIQAMQRSWDAERAALVAVREQKASMVAEAEGRLRDIKARAVHPGAEVCHVVHGRNK